jgi:hypothetical protein
MLSSRVSCLLPPLEATRPSSSRTLFASPTPSPSGSTAPRESTARPVWLEPSTRTFNDCLDIRNEFTDELPVPPLARRPWRLSLPSPPKPLRTSALARAPALPAPALDLAAALDLALAAALALAPDLAHPHPASARRHPSLLPLRTRSTPHPESARSHSLALAPLPWPCWLSCRQTVAVGCVFSVLLKEIALLKGLEQCVR